MRNFPSRVQTRFKAHATTLDASAKRAPGGTAVSLQFACRHSSEQKHWVCCGWHILPLPLILFDCSVVPQVLCDESYIRCLGAPDWGITNSQATPIPLVCSCFCCQSLISYLSKFPASAWRRTAANW